jgi:hypothetical protein
MWKYLQALVKGLTCNTDGSFSSTKFWQGVAYTIASWAMVELTLHDKMTAEMLLIYLASAAGGRAFQNYLATKSGKSS